MAERGLSSCRGSLSMVVSVLRWSPAISSSECVAETESEDWFRGVPSSRIAVFAAESLSKVMVADLVAPSAPEDGVSVRLVILPQKLPQR